MVTLAELIAQSQAAFPSAFQKAAGPSGFSLLAPQIQVAAAQVVQERAAITRSIFPTGTAGLTQFIKEQSQDIVNLFKLGAASVDISGALNEQITLREQQLAKTTEAIRNQQIFTTSVQEQSTASFKEITESLKNIGQGGFDPIQFLTDNPIIGGIGIGGLLVGGVILLVVLR